MFVAHRINTIEELKKVPKEVGVEIDLRDSGDKLILAHDPFVDGEDFEEWLKYYEHSFIILNIKSERIEYKVLELIKRYEIKHYFFLDSSFPMYINLIKEGEKNVSLRISEFESEKSVYHLNFMFNWIWVDCFTTNWILTKAIFTELKSKGFNICLVSPELQQHSKEDIEDYIAHLKKEGIVPDMVCSKIYNYELWQAIYN